MRWLVIDRSTAKPGMALFENDTLRCERLWDGAPARAPAWLCDVAQCVRAINGSFAAFDCLVCGLGPGSFSGIRAGLAALQGMALPGRVPVVGVASAAALALGQARGCERITVIGDARRNRIWCVTYQVDPVAGRVRLDSGALPSHREQDFTLTPAEQLREHVPPGTRIVTSEWERLATRLTTTFDASRLVPEARFPHSVVLGRLAMAEREACVAEPMPIYLHPAVALQQGG